MLCRMSICFLAAFATAANMAHGDITAFVGPDDEAAFEASVRGELVRIPFLLPVNDELGAQIPELYFEAVGNAILQVSDTVDEIDLFQDPPGIQVDPGTGNHAPTGFSVTFAEPVHAVAFWHHDENTNLLVTIHYDDGASPSSLEITHAGEWTGQPDPSPGVFWGLISNTANIASMQVVNQDTLGSDHWGFDDFRWSRTVTVPASSTWGIVIMSILAMIAATVILARTRESEMQEGSPQR